MSFELVDMNDLKKLALSFQNMPPAPTLTFRTTLRDRAAKKAQHVGVPLSWVLNNALRNFLKSDDSVVIGKPQLIKLPADLQKKADALGKGLPANKKMAKQGRYDSGRSSGSGGGNDGGRSGGGNDGGRSGGLQPAEQPQHPAALQAYLITWVTHNSRVSERMVKYGVKTGDPFVLSDDDRTFVAERLNEKIRAEGWRVLALNVLRDHVHLVLVCAQEDLSEIVRNLKGFTSFELGRQLKLSVTEEGRQHKVWGKGSSHTFLDGEEHFANAIEYTLNNHLKHEIPALNSALQRAALVDIDSAFAEVSHRQQ